MYNPFKLHIVQNGNDRYIIRVMKFGWRYPWLWGFNSSDSLVSFEKEYTKSYKNLADAKIAAAKIKYELAKIKVNNENYKKSRQIKKVIQ